MSRTHYQCEPWNRYGRTRTKVSLDMYNALNSHVGITYNNTFNFLPATAPSGEWLAPTSILAARVMKIGASIDF